MKPTSATSHITLGLFPRCRWSGEDKGQARRGALCAGRVGGGQCGGPRRLIQEQKGQGTCGTEARGRGLTVSIPFSQPSSGLNPPIYKRRVVRLCVHSLQQLAGLLRECSEIQLHSGSLINVCSRHFPLQLVFWCIPSTPAPTPRLQWIPTGYQSRVSHPNCTTGCSSPFSGPSDSSAPLLHPPCLAT